MRKNAAILAALLVLLTCAAGAEPVDELFAWSVRFSGDSSTKAGAMTIASDGGAFVVGSTNRPDDSFGKAYQGLDGFILRVSEQGDILWQHRFGGDGDDIFTHVLETNDGGCLAMGTTTSSNGDARAARGGMDALLVKLSADGETLWTKCLGGTLDDELLAIHEAQDGTLVACGRTRSRNGDLGANFGGFDAWFTMLSPGDGKPLSTTDRFGQAGDDAFTALIPISGGWLVLGEYGEQQGADSEGEPVFMNMPVIIHYRATGERAWQEPVILRETGESRLVAAMETDIGWLLLGETNSRSPLLSTRGGTDLWLVSLRQNGLVQWQRTYGGSADEHPTSINGAGQGLYLLLSSTESQDGQVLGSHGDDDLWLLRCSSTGSLEWQQVIGGSGRSIPAGIITLPGGDTLVAGTTLSQDGDIGRHASLRAGFLTLVSQNGNLKWTAVVGDGEECAIEDIQSVGNFAYALCSIRTITQNDMHENLLLLRLSPELYPTGDGGAEEDAR